MSSIDYSLYKITSVTRQASQDKMAERNESTLYERAQKMSLNNDDTDNGGADEDNSLETFLDENNVHKDWKDFILNDESVKSGLKKARKFLKGCGKKYEGKEYIPDNRIILRAFHADFGGPDNIKVVILGHDPIPNAELATGLSFSLPAEKTGGFSFPKQTPPGDVEGKSVIKFNQAVARAIAESSVCNEYMAKNGILLLNAALTVGRDEPRRDEHFEAWRNFTFNLLKTLLLKLKNDHNRDLIILCLGTNAMEIGKKLVKFSENQENIMLDCDHPTFTKRVSGNNFHTEAPKQFEKILKKYPDIFNKQ